MNNNEQSCIDWLVEQLVKYNEEMVFLYQKEIEQAKAMQQEQAQQYAEFCVQCDRQSLPLLDFNSWIAHNETFNTKREMTPKELAEDLFDRVIEVEDRKWDIDDGCGISVDQAKQIAIFIVDNLIKNTLMCYEDCFNHDNWHGDYDTKRSSTIIEYYVQVKEEIENIN